MKKILSFAAVAALALSAQANTRVLFSQTFEGVTDATKAGWTKHDDNSGLDIVSDEEGSILKVYTAGNDRASYLFWGDAIYTSKEGQNFITDGHYRISYEFNYQTAANNNYKTSMTVFSGEYTLDKNGHQSYGFIGESNHWLFDMTQTGTAAENASAQQFICDKDSVNQAGITVGEWYGVELDVDVEKKTVDYVVTPFSASTPVFQGSYQVPDTVDIYATGLNVLIARYASVVYIDNIKVSCESDVDVANDPVIALSRIGTELDPETDEYNKVNLNLRAYNITFNEEHTLHIKGTDGKEVSVDYLDCEGAYKYETTTTGTLTAWTTYGEAKSEEITMAVDCSPCKLPKAEAAISNVQEGFGKQYTLTASNADVPLQPTIYLEYTFTGKDGSTKSEKNLSNGAKVDVPGEGELVVKTSALGYEGNEMSVENNIEYTIKEKYDFARATEEQILAYGFKKIDDLRDAATSGETNWTGRKRLFYYDIATKTTNDAGEEVYTAVYPFGYDEANENACIHRYQLSVEDLDAGKDSTAYPGVIFWKSTFNSKESGNPSPVQWNQNIGILSVTTSNNYRPITFTGLNVTDFLVVNYINDYGGNSNHPIVANADEYYAVLAGDNAVISGRDAVPAGETPDVNKEYRYTYQLYRIDTAMTCATIFGLADPASVSSVAADQENSDPYYYTIDGLRMLEPAHTGLYIHNGKKVYIVK